MNDTCVIFGSFLDTRNGFDWSRKDCDLWTFNESLSKNTWVHWCTGVFQMHLPAVWRNPLNRNDKDHYDWLKMNDAVPVYMQEHFDDVPMSVKYPFDELVAELLPGWERDKNQVWDNRGGYFNSTPDYALALAIYKGYKHIELWGFGLAVDTEYVYQRPGCFFWQGLALGRGITVKLVGHMAEAPLYGFQGDEFISLDIIESRIAELEPQLPEVKKKYEESRVAGLSAVSNFKLNRLNEADRAKAQELFSKSKPTSELRELDDCVHFIASENAKKAMLDKANACVAMAQVNALLLENRRYANKVKEMRAHSGSDDFRFSRTEFEGQVKALRKKCAETMDDRNLYRLSAEQLFTQIDKAETYANRRAAIDAWVKAYDEDLKKVIEWISYDAMLTENGRYCQIFDQQYRAAGKSPHDDAAGSVKEQ